MNRKSIVPVAALALLALTACTASTPPVVTARLTTVEKGTSAFETDPAVLAARASNLAQAQALNAKDFSLPQLAETTSTSIVSNEYRHYLHRFVAQGESPIVTPGPIIFLPTGVKISSTGAIVSACEVSSDWFTSKSHAASYDLKSGTKVEYVLSRESKSQALKLDEIAGLTVPCDATGALVQKFSPAPKLPTKWIESEVRAPAGGTT